MLLGERPAARFWRIVLGLEYRLSSNSQEQNLSESPVSTSSGEGGQTKWQPVIIALAFIALVAILFIFTMNRMSNTDDFLKVWAAVGPIVGVVTGLIPTYFFHNSAREASARAEAMAAENGKLRAEGTGAFLHSKTEEKESGTATTGC
jgi:hypothetical protein